MYWSLKLQCNSDPCWNLSGWIGKGFVYENVHWLRRCIGVRKSAAWLPPRAYPRGVPTVFNRTQDRRPIESNLINCSLEDKQPYTLATWAFEIRKDGFMYTHIIDHLRILWRSSNRGHWQARTKTAVEKGHFSAQKESEISSNQNSLGHFNSCLFAHFKFARLPLIQKKSRIQIKFGNWKQIPEIRIRGFCCACRGHAYDCRNYCGNYY